MPTIGQTTEPTFGAEWFGSGSDNQHSMLVTMTEAGTITRLGGWLRGKDAACSFRFCVWNGSGVLLGQTSLLTASGASFAIGASLNYEDDLQTPVDVDDGDNLFLGFSRNPNGAMQFGYDTSGDHYDKDTGSTWPASEAGHSLHSGRGIGMYAEYDVGSETYVRRGSVWVKNEEVYVRRAGAWVAAGAEVYVRRGGAWVKAQ